MFEPGSRVTVVYPLTGYDRQNLMMEIGQRVGLETMSTTTSMEMDPMIRDVERERHRLVVDKLDKALLESVAVQMADPHGPYQPGDGSMLRRLVRDGMDISDAIDKVQEAAQERQATAVPEGDPAAMPGLALPGLGVESPVLASESFPSLESFDQLVSDLRPG